MNIDAFEMLIGNTLQFAAEYLIRNEVPEKYRVWQKRARKREREGKKETPSQHNSTWDSLYEVLRVPRVRGSKGISRPRSPVSVQEDV